MKPVGVGVITSYSIHYTKLYDFAFERGQVQGGCCHCFRPRLASGAWGAHRVETREPNRAGGAGRETRRRPQGRLGGGPGHVLELLARL